MGNVYVNDAGSFLINFIFGFYLVVVLLRLIFQLVRADFYNPISQFIVTVTNPPLKILRRFIPGFGGVDIASIVLLILVALVKNYCLGALAGQTLKFSGALLLSLADITSLTITVLIYAIVISAIMSWFAPRGPNPAIRLVHSVTNPILAPARRIVPNLGGIDISPIIVIVVLTLATKLIVQPIYDLAATLL